MDYQKMDEIVEWVRDGDAGPYPDGVEFHGEDLVNVVLAIAELTGEINTFDTARILGSERRCRQFDQWAADFLTHLRAAHDEYQGER